MPSVVSTGRDVAPVERVRFALRPVHIAPLVPFFLVAVIVAAPIRDNSFLWHVRAGTIQLDSLRVLTEDPFSLTFTGTPWRTQSWWMEFLYAHLERWFVGLA